MLRKGSKIPYLVKEAESTYNAYPALDTPAIVANMINQLFNLKAQTEEYVYLICLDTKNHPVGIFELS